MEAPVPTSESMVLAAAPTNKKSRLRLPSVKKFFSGRKGNIA
jgi:hypothetical protein